MSRGLGCALLLTLSGAGCATDEAQPTAFRPLDAPQLLRRLSLDLRGDLPNLDELAQAEAHPEWVVAMGDEMLEGSAFERRFAALIAEQWLTRVDQFNVGALDFSLSGDIEPAFVRDIGNEAPIFLAAVAAEDLPWTEAVTADWTMTTPILRSIWPVERIDGRDSTVDGWERARYTDGRPAGGVVMTNGLWWRYWSAPNNYNRTRAAAIGRLLLCDDWLTRPVHIDPAADVGPSDLEEAVRTQTACVGCHDSLDPLASALFGFWWFDLYDPLEMRAYHPEREFLGPRYLDVEPAWFGRAMDGPADLGRRIAEDPRFTRCTAQRTAQSYWRRTLDDEDFATVGALVTEFEGGGLTMRSLVRAVTHHPEYGAAGFVADADADDAVATLRVLQPSQLATIIQTLTGYTWTEAGYTQLDNDTLGYRVLAGGVDGAGVTVPSEQPTVTRALVLQRVAEAAASHVVDRDFGADRSDRRLLTEVEASDGPDDATFAAQLELLHRRMHGHDPSPAELAEELALAERLLADGAESAAVWKALIELMIRDPAFWSY